MFHGLGNETGTIRSADIGLTEPITITFTIPTEAQTYVNLRQNIVFNLDDVPWPESMTSDIVVTCAAWTEIPTSSKRTAKITFARNDADKQFSIQIPKTYYDISTIASGTPIEFEMEGVFNTYFESKVKQGNFDMAGTCTAFIPFKSTQMTGIIKSNVQCSFSYYKGEGLRVYPQDLSTNINVNTFFGTCNLSGFEVKPVGVDAIKLIFTPLDQPEEETKTNPKPKVQMLSNVVTL